MARFTPGPWQVDHDDLEERLIIRTIEPQTPNWDIAEITCWEDYDQNDWDRVHANARLIAAAPALYEALKMARDCIAYCRKAHPDAQSGEGIPIEIFIDRALTLADKRTE